MPLLVQQPVFSEVIPKPRVVTEIFATVRPLILKKIHGVSGVRTSFFYWAHQSMFYPSLLPFEDTGKSNLRNVVGFLTCDIAQNFSHDTDHKPSSELRKFELTDSMWQMPSLEANSHSAIQESSVFNWTWPFFAVFTSATPCILSEARWIQSKSEALYNAQLHVYLESTFLAPLRFLS